ncbi:GGDEF domain-containing protein [Shewanella dokdonensis]|uniref:GGDEF domain-containing protein n=1 Tax=Shewanella dokdonensis TaxID=712036 RepID=UPI0020106D0F|nr:GGDEF domain-containing protein [Shewanella dokdonensis]MCL1074071.1 GGDEF domain-containing protein [Shewanella dokdonensis]
MPSRSFMRSPAMWEDEVAYRRTLLRIILWVIALLAFALSLSNLHHDVKTVSILESCITLYCLLFLLRVQRTSHLHWWTSGLMLTVGGVIIYGMYSKGLYTDGFYWLLLMPPVNMLLLGLLLGGVFTFCFGVLGVSVMLWAQPALDGSLDVALLINASVSYLFLWGMSHIFEYKRVQMVRQLREIAARDPLTGLHNRLHLENIFGQIAVSHTAANTPFTLLLLDIDHFKHINDENGHEAGDLILCQLSQRMTVHTRASDWLFRVGGEEFCILLPKTHKADAIELAERLRTDIEKLAPTFHKHPIHFTVSIGLAQWPLDGQDFDALYRQADMRLYEAKRRGRNQIITGLH